MHSPVNYYIVNLGICDFLVGAFVLPTKVRKNCGSFHLFLLGNLWHTWEHFSDQIGPHNTASFGLFLNSIRVALITLRPEWLRELELHGHELVHVFFLESSAYFVLHLFAQFGTICWGIFPLEFGRLTERLFSSFRQNGGGSVRIRYCYVITMESLGACSIELQCCIFNVSWTCSNGIWAWWLWRNY